jgi:hypothetical protein
MSGFIKWLAKDIIADVIKEKDEIVKNANNALTLIGQELIRFDTRIKLLEEKLGIIPDPETKSVVGTTLVDQLKATPAANQATVASTTIPETKTE